MNRVNYRLPGTRSIKSAKILNRVDYAVSKDDLCFVFCPFEGDALKHRYTAKPIPYEHEENSASHKPILTLEHVDLKNYELALKKAIVDISADDLEKVVLARTIKLTGELNTHAVFNELESRLPDAFVYHLILNGVNYIGATPEVLITQQGLKVNSASLAGTIKNNKLNATISWTDKEFHEQSLVTEFVLRQYKQSCNNVVVSDLQNFIAGPVTHLYQNISGSLKELHAIDDLITALHPTPAVCGLPVEKAKRWLKDHEPIDREYYAGYIGFMESGNTNLYVNLRCLKYSNNVSTLYFGGGIVKDSTYLKELEETEHKAQTLLSSIQESHHIIQ